MATSVEFIEFVCEQIRGTGNIRYKKMFGEYMVWVDEKPILLVCDDTVYVKMLPVLDELMINADKGFPYGGAKEHYILDIDDSETARRVVEELLQVVPVRKPRSKKKKV
ncbi:MAG: TfoX/Sxy family protein [Bifidobacteriaceae bacterium]|jgi:TfoX/Sxy family transcriptional regulator of competence genes|nr:TfoX/Sxy family protein [Bifidobacteriaceae bacterium]